MYDLTAFSQREEGFSLEGQVDSSGITDIHHELVTRVRHGIAGLQ